MMFTWNCAMLQIVTIISAHAIHSGEVGYVLFHIDSLGCTDGVIHVVDVLILTECVESLVLFFVSYYEFPKFRFAIQAMLAMMRIFLTVTITAFKCTIEITCPCRFVVCDEVTGECRSNLQ